jgi:hypothetical protein
MAKKIDPKRIESALAKATDETSFLQHVLIDLLDWPIDPKIKTVEEIAYDWTKEELRAANLDKKVVEGRIRQIALPGCPWGVFIVEFKNPEVFQSGRGMTVPLRQVLSGLVPKQKRAATVEFKSSARWDVKNGKPEKFIERIIVKTVAALLNTQGGTLVIGVEDDGKVYGLTEDYKLSGGKGRDSFENWLTQTLLKDFGKDAAGLLSVTFHDLAPENCRSGILPLEESGETPLPQVLRGKSPLQSINAT